MQLLDLGNIVLRNKNQVKLNKIKFHQIKPSIKNKNQVKPNKKKKDKHIASAVSTFLGV